MTQNIKTTFVIESVNTLFGYHLFCWNRKLIVEGIADKGKS